MTLGEILKKNNLLKKDIKKGVFILTIENGTVEVLYEGNPFNLLCALFSNNSKDNLQMIKAQLIEEAYKLSKERELNIDKLNEKLKLEGIIE